MTKSVSYWELHSQVPTGKTRPVRFDDIMVDINIKKFTFIRTNSAAENDTETLTVFDINEEDAWNQLQILQQLLKGNQLGY